MKARIKFSKNGSLIYIGHLDVMRYFQKAIRRAGLPIAFSEGFSPHMIMSFAQPLGVGMYSEGEYFDIELLEYIEPKKAIDDLNKVMADGIKIKNFVYISDDKKQSGMTIVAAATYLAKLSLNKSSLDNLDMLTLEEDNNKELKNFDNEEDKIKFFNNKIQEYFNRDEIVVLKKTKRSEKEVDIKPMILDMKYSEQGLFLFLLTGSENNLKPNLVVSDFLIFCNLPNNMLTTDYKRLDVFAKNIKKTENIDNLQQENNNFIPLDACTIK
ncbi:MAG: TIGR03936 family radical SAM-associated protein [Lachnospiraceae bacterium]|jgi:radical SAM-linked protein|nr:TIGR03936 family radical SAM-associated protein [Lachnospiraceae bacterium]